MNPILVFLLRRFLPVFADFFIAFFRDRARRRLSKILTPQIAELVGQAAEFVGKTGDEKRRFVTDRTLAWARIECPALLSAVGEDIATRIIHTAIQPILDNLFPA